MSDTGFFAIIILLTACTAVLVDKRIRAAFLALVGREDILGEFAPLRGVVDDLRKLDFTIAIAKFNGAGPEVFIANKDLLRPCGCTAILWMGFVNTKSGVDVTLVEAHGMSVVKSIIIRKTNLEGLKSALSRGLVEAELILTLKDHNDMVGIKGLVEQVTTMKGIGEIYKGEKHV